MIREAQASRRARAAGRHADAAQLRRRVRAELRGGVPRAGAARTASALVPFLLEGFADKLELFQPDRIHPTEAAQPLMLERVWKELRPLLK